MTVQTLYTAATGMEAMETKLDVIANNMANINTTAFKKDRCEFRGHVLSPVPVARRARTPTATRTATGIEVGLGTRVSSTQTNFKQGAFQTTNNPLDLAIEGDGFFQRAKSERRLLLHAGRQFQFERERADRAGLGNEWLSCSSPDITVPPEATGIVITTDGQVQYSTQDSTTLQHARADYSSPSS